MVHFIFASVKIVDSVYHLIYIIIVLDADVGITMIVNEEDKWFEEKQLLTSF